MNHDIPAYGLWPLVIINSAVFIIFAFSFSHPYRKLEWRSFNAFSAFIVALFAEMYGFPLTIYLFSGWLSSRFPNLDLFSHESGHLWFALLGYEGNPHANPIHLVSNLLIFIGFILLSASWRVLYAAQRERRIATRGPYAVIRHPQYVGFTIILLGFLLQWPTLITLVMFPILITMYVKLARREEKDSQKEFGAAWDEYVSKTPPWFPRLGGTNATRITDSESQPAQAQSWKYQSDKRGELK